MAKEQEAAIADDDEDVEESEETSVTVVKAGTSYDKPDGKKGELKARVEFDPGVDLDTACEFFGEEVVYQRYLRGVLKDLGNAIRSGLNREIAAAESAGQAIDPEAIVTKVQNSLANWRPDVVRRATKKTPETAILSNFDDLSAERQQEILEALMAKVQNAG